MPENESPEQLRQQLDAKLTGLERLRLAGLVTEERYVQMREQLITAAGAPLPPQAPPSTAAQPYAPPPAAAAPPAAVPPPSPAAPAPPPAEPAPPAASPGWSVRPAADAPAAPAPAPAYVPPAAPPPSYVPPAPAAPPAAPPSPTYVPPAAAAPPAPTPSPTYAPPAPAAPIPTYVPPPAAAQPPVPTPYAPPQPAAPPAWSSSDAYGTPPLIPPAPPARPPAPPRGRNTWLAAVAGLLVLLGGGTFAGVVLHAHNASDTSSAASSSSSSSGEESTPASTPVPTQHADMNKVRQAYLAAMNPVGQSWVNLDNAFKSAESKPCSQCPPGTFDITPVIPKIVAVIDAYHSSIAELSIIEAELDGQPSSDVGALVNGMRRALVAFENELTSGSSSGTIDDSLAGTLVQANKDASDLDNVVRKEIGLTPGAPIT